MVKTRRHAALGEEQIPVESLSIQTLPKADERRTMVKATTSQTREQQLLQVCTRGWRKLAFWGGPAIGGRKRPER